MAPKPSCDPVGNRPCWRAGGNSFLLGQAFGQMELMPHRQCQMQLDLGFSAAWIFRRWSSLSVRKSPNISVRWLAWTNQLHWKICSWPWKTKEKHLGKICLVDQTWIKMIRSEFIVQRLYCSNPSLVQGKGWLLPPQIGLGSWEDRAWKSFVLRFGSPFVWTPHQKTKEEEPASQRPKDVSHYFWSEDESSKAGAVQSIQSGMACEAHIVGGGGCLKHQTLTIWEKPIPFWSIMPQPVFWELKKHFNDVFKLKALFPYVHPGSGWSLQGAPRSSFLSALCACSLAKLSCHRSKWWKSCKTWQSQGWHQKCGS